MDHILSYDCFCSRNALAPVNSKVCVNIELIFVYIQINKLACVQTRSKGRLSIKLFNLCQGSLQFFFTQVNVIFVQKSILSPGSKIWNVRNLSFVALLWKHVNYLLPMRKLCDKTSAFSSRSDNGYVSFKLRMCHQILKWTNQTPLTLKLLDYRVTFKNRNYFIRLQIITVHVNIAHVYKCLSLWHTCALYFINLLIYFQLS